MVSDVSKRTNPNGLAGWLIVRLTGGPFVLAFVLVGAITELWLLGTVKDPIYASADGGRLLPVIAVVSLVWIWISIGWLLWGVSSIVGRLIRRLPRLAQPVAAMMLLLAGMVLCGLYLFSWTVYLRTGQFANIESVRFALENTSGSWLWHYLATSEPVLLLCFGLLLIAQVVLLPLLVVLARKPWAGAESVKAAERRIAWWTVTLFTWVIAVVMVTDRSMLRVSGQTYELTHRLNPLVTFVTSGASSLSQDRIEPCLDEQQLVAIEQDNSRAVVSLERRPSIIFVAVESLRHDVIGLQHQNREVTPHLNQLARAGVHLRRAYTQSTHSDYSDVCVVSSLYPLRTRRHHYYRATDPWPKTMIYDLLKSAGYRTAIVSSQDEGWGGMQHFLLTPNLDLFYDARSSGVATAVSPLDVAMRREVASGALVGKHDDEHTTTKAIEWIRAQVASSEPFFLSMTYQNSHFPYPLPEEAERPFQPGMIDFPASFVDYPVEKTEIVRNAYYNSIRYSDRQLGRLIEALEQLHVLDETILVVYGENGESFHENGQVTHANKPYEPAVRVAGVIHAPQHLAPAQEDYPFELVDIVPTVMGIVGVPLHPNFQGIDALAADRPPLDERRCLIHVSHALASCDAMIVGGRWKVIRYHDTNDVEFFDLEQDPFETQNLAGSQHPVLRQLLPEIQRWRREQLAYYHFPFYYQQYYPPRFRLNQAVTDDRRQ